MKRSKLLLQKFRTLNQNKRSCIFLDISKKEEEEEEEEEKKRRI